MRHSTWGLVVVGLVVVGVVSTRTRDAGADDAVTPTSEEMQARADVMNGRYLVITHGCGDCHGGGADPASPFWLSGARDTTQQFKIGPFITRPRNITPDNQTGIGRFTERQIFNALRYGLRPGETPDVEITSRTPGQGNFPLTPKYLAVPMPWNSWRHMRDQDLWDMAAYLKRAVRPVSHRVEDSDGPPDFWASAWADSVIGSYPSPAFPTAQERAP